ncbi:MAG: periplasmic heavy metal sensor [Chitinophagaceae bacterium]|nr:periplasmic heavy metal sensor [Chitinophagaceae bacterium]MBP8114756.1 periplasmic heavy metal sensor [Chitinophagaceae bacterium]
MKNSTNKFLVIAVILLLIVNIALVAFMVIGKDKKPQSGRDGSKPAFEKMVNELGMNETQKKEFDSLREAHFATIRPLFDSMRITRQALYNLIKEDTLNDSLVSAYSNNITEKQSRADKLTINHFRTVRKMFSGDMLNKYDEMVQKMLQRGKKDSSDKKDKK